MAKTKQTPWRKKLKRYETKVRAEGKYSKKQIPVVALSRAQESEVQGLGAKDPKVRLQAIIDLTYEWEGTTTTSNEIAVMARSLRRATQHVLDTMGFAQTLALGGLLNQFRFATSPDQLAVTKYKTNVASGKKGGNQKQKHSDKAALVERNKYIVRMAVDLIKSGVERSDILDRLVAKFGMGSDPLSRKSLETFYSKAKKTQRPA